MEIAGYIAAIFIGISLGLIGSGGSILTVPVLVYFFNTDAVTATSYSLFIVGLTSAVGSYSYFRKGMVSKKVVALFGIPSIISVILTRNFIVPAIPESLGTVAGIHLSRDLLLLILFAILMAGASYSMIKQKNILKPIAGEEDSLKISLVIMNGFLIGIITGLIGAGGGFLIIPALIMLLKVPMKAAVGNSLAIIAANSFIGFLSSHNHQQINWWLLLSVSTLAIAGIFIGIRLSKNIDGEKLKPAFGWFILVMAIFIILKETIGHSV
ncbi:MAG TPA: sulfite exporter TauE/SafE family protein [Ferruginibacter sp.]|nr:sulfite exporter TauE/SafE family protein [Ferruginibacter sp.]HRE63402.1 sulfite exporter TauE/SafE family protein [Ferruginibacter sp.]